MERTQTIEGVYEGVKYVISMEAHRYHVLLPASQVELELPPVGYAEALGFVKGMIYSLLYVEYLHVAKPAVPFLRLVTSDADEG